MMEALKKAYLRFDRHLGGGRPPTRIQAFILRHPLLIAVGLTATLMSPLLGTPSLFTDPRTLLVMVASGAAAVLIFWSILLLEAKVQRRNEREGYVTEPPNPPPAQRREGVVLLVRLWLFGTLVFWLLGVLFDGSLSLAAAATKAVLCMGIGLLVEWINTRSWNQPR